MHSAGMVKSTISANLKRLMSYHPSLNTLKKVTAAGGPPNGVLDRIRREDGACRVDTLAQLAGVFGLQPWQMLVPDLDPAHLPQLEMTAEKAAELRQHLAAIANIIPKDEQPGA